MKIGIVSSSNNDLTLFKFLSKYDYEYIVFYDQLYSFWEDKTLETMLFRLKKGVKFLQEKGVDNIIVPPIFELILDEKYIKENKILSLFKTYVKDYCFRYSIVGKIGILSGFIDRRNIQNGIVNLANDYVLQKNQKNIKNFHFPFKYWMKNTNIWKYFLVKLSWSDIFVNRMIKNDLRCFKDANVDTLIPMNYGYFNFEKTILRFFNYKKTRFHKLDKIEIIFKNIVSSSNFVNKKYGISVFYTDHIRFLKNEKRLVWLMQRGKQIDIQYQKIDL